MRITPKEGFRDFKNKKGDIIKSNGKPLRVQDFDGQYTRNDIINYLDGFIDKAKHRDPNVRYCVMLKSTGTYNLSLKGRIYKMFGMMNTKITKFAALGL